MKVDREEALCNQIQEAATIIEFLLPFAKGKSSTSGDVMGAVVNAKNWLRAPIVVAARTIAKDPK